MIPIADENPKGFFPFVNYLFIIINIAVYFFLQPSDPESIERFFRHFGLVPATLINEPQQIRGYITIFTSMFLHGGLGHLFGNMLYLWIFGDNIEYVIGHLRYVVFYLLVGLGAAMLQIIVMPGSEAPMVGASGAISGVLGAYLLRFPRNNVSVLFFFFFIIRVVRIPAVIVLSVWFLFQVINGYFHFMPGAQTGVAWFAHIGGFVSGFILIKLFELRERKK